MRCSIKLGIKKLDSRLNKNASLMYYFPYSILLTRVKLRNQVDLISSSRRWPSLSGQVLRSSSFPGGRSNGVLLSIRSVIFLIKSSESSSSERNQPAKAFIVFASSCVTSKLSSDKRFEPKIFEQKV